MYAWYLYILYFTPKEFLPLVATAITMSFGATGAIIAILITSQFGKLTYPKKVNLSKKRQPNPSIALTILALISIPITGKCPAKRNDGNQRCTYDTTGS